MFRDCQGPESGRTRCLRGLVDAQKVGRMLVAKTRILAGWIQEIVSRGLLNRLRRPHCPAGMDLVQLNVFDFPQIFDFWIFSLVVLDGGW